MKKFLAVMLGLGLLAASTLAYAGEWTGRLEKMGQKLSFVSAGKVYSVANPEKAAGFEGKKVTLVGSADESTKTITINSLSLPKSA